MPHISLKLTPAQAGALGVRPLAWMGFWVDDAESFNAVPLMELPRIC
jgi:hypothetical protein